MIKQYCIGSGRDGDRSMIFSGSTIFAGLSYIDSLYYQPTLVCHRLLYPNIYRNAQFGVSSCLYFILIFIYFPQLP